MIKNFGKKILLLTMLVFLPAFIYAAEGEHAHEDGQVDVKEIIFEHLGDGYGWEVPFVHQYRIPLPVIVRAEDGSWHCFSSARLTKLVEYREEILDKDNGKVKTKTKHELEPVPVNIEKKGKTYTFYLSQSESYHNKVVQLLAPVAGEETVTVDGKIYSEYRTLDVSITKNVLALLIAAVVVTLMMLSIVRWYRKNPYKAPRKGHGFLELIVEFIYDGVIKAILGKNAPRFAPYLLTAFFFILVMNLLGLIVIFPGGANLTGNIAITLVLALLTFIITNIKATKHYWKEIFWPDVPLFLKFPLPIMQFIEIFGIFTKPAALCVRLFANMMGGHIIVITLILLIFIFGAFGMAAMSGVTIVSILFTIFMLLLDVLVSFIQAYVFTMLSTLFISLAQEEGHHEKKGHEESETRADETSDTKIAAAAETK